LDLPDLRWWSSVEAIHALAAKRSLTFPAATCDPSGTTINGARKAEAPDVRKMLHPINV
jgi:hypothetical protein